MSKKKSRKKKIIPQKTIFIPPGETTSSPPLHPNATLTPEASMQRPTSGTLLAGDSTSAPQVGELSGEPANYAPTHAALIDKYLLSRHSITFVLALAVIGFLFIQDNAAEKLINWKGIWWTLQKSGILLVVFLFILFCQFLYKRLLDNNT